MAAAAHPPVERPAHAAQPGLVRAGRAARRQLGAPGGAAHVRRDPGERHDQHADQQQERLAVLVHQLTSRTGAASASASRNAAGIFSPASSSPAQDPAAAAGSGACGRRRGGRPERLGLEPRERRQPEHLAPLGRDRGDLRDAAAAVGVAVDLHDHVDRGVDLVAQRLERDLQVAHRRQRLEPVHGVVGRVRVDRDERALVAGVERLEHVERLAAADLADDDPVGAHAQRVAHEVADRDLAAALDVGRARLERDDVRLLQPQLGVVLDRDDPLAVRDGGRQGVQQRRLAGAGAAGDDDVELRAHEGAQQVRRVGGRASRCRRAARA